MTNHSEQLNTKQVAQMLGKHPVTVKKWRMAGKGPAYLRVGDRIVYLYSTVLDYLVDSSRYREGETA